MIHTRETLAVAPGLVTLAYPEWVQGEHTASGPLTQVAGFTVSAAGRTLVWRRDALQAFLFHVEVPAGVAQVEVRLDYLSPPVSFGSGYGETPNVTPHLAIVDWHDLLVYPVGRSLDQIAVRPSLRLPAGWQFATALHGDGDATGHVRGGGEAGGAGGPGGAGGGAVAFDETSLYTLIDSPVLAGEIFRSIEIVPAAPGRAPVRLVVAADRRAAIAVPEERIAAYRRLVGEAEALFGARHYLAYTWLLALGDGLDENGLEHHESSDDRGRLGMFTEPALLFQGGSLLPHEYVHSWNGKYRRPAGLAVHDAQEPLRTGLLWVYEGLTRYLGDLVLTTRSGIRTVEQSREYAAFVAASQDQARPGRRWRSLGDTAVGLPAFDGAPTPWTAYRRARDYYDESMLIWLEADTVLRRESGGKRSLDDFCRAFYGGASSSPAVVPYTADDVYAALGQLVPFDWRGFFTRRIDDIAPRAPLGGIEAAGWQLVYDERPNAYQAARSKNLDLVDLSFSLGLWAKPDGTVIDVVVGSPAWEAGVGPAAKLVAIGHRTWSAEAAADALAAAAHATAPIALTVAADDVERTLAVDYHGGDRHPHLERDAARPDLLQAILAPRGQ